MNQIHEKDWAEDDWGWHSGMQSFERDRDAVSEDAASVLEDDERDIMGDLVSA